MPLRRLNVPTVSFQVPLQIRSLEIEHVHAPIVAPRDELIRGGGEGDLVYGTFVVGFYAHYRRNRRAV